ncbi:hypothetical protein SNE40_018013 [Patella caerulea]|uniref:Fibrinogen C-terminal domain-containing protein n=1 Tax=Patella caerulea TaxID=87958 RepID=A0AAN8PAW7_PATCE
MIQITFVFLLISFSRAVFVEYRYESPKSCEHLTVPTATAYKSLTVDWMLDCVRQCSHDSSCLSATFDGSQTCFLFSDDQRNCSEPKYNHVFFVVEFAPVAMMLGSDGTSTVTAPTCLNNGTLDPVSATCQCYKGYIGDNCHRIMMDCTEGFYSGHYNNHYNGLYLIKPTAASEPFQVQCNMKDFGGGTFFMMNSQYAVNPSLTRNLDWNKYKDGFGEILVNSANWIGVEKIHSITSSRPHHLFVEAMDNIKWERRWRKYEHFKVEDESTNYRMTYSGSFPWTQTEASADPGWTKAIASTPLGDSMIGLNGSAFSTFDRDNDLDAARNCAREYQGGWWYNACADCNPNGQIKTSGNASSINELYWETDTINSHVVHIQMMLIAN